jgi:hypothetical protein
MTFDTYDGARLIANGDRQKNESVHLELEVDALLTTTLDHVSNLENMTWIWS